VRAKIYVTLKKGVSTPREGDHRLPGPHRDRRVEDVRFGKYMEVRLHDMGVEEARRRLDEACRRLLANTVIEDYRVEVEG